MPLGLGNRSAIPCRSSYSRSRVLPGATVTVHARQQVRRPRRSRAACAAARKAEADARDVKIVCGWLMDAVVERAEVNAALDIKDVAHAPRYGRVDVARSLIEQGGEVDRPDDVRDAKIEAFFRVADELESDWDSVS